MTAPVSRVEQASDRIIFLLEQQLGGIDGGVVLAHHVDDGVQMRQVTPQRGYAMIDKRAIAFACAAEAAQLMAGRPEVPGDVRSEIAGRAEDENAHRVRKQQRSTRRQESSRAFRRGGEG
ncbi:hypothetical protein TomTYG45_29920 [Sphingobium sp. TomTYG45]